MHNWLLNYANERKQYEKKKHSNTLLIQLAKGQGEEGRGGRGEEEIWHT